MGPGQHPDACALTCTAWTKTSSLLVAVPSTLMVASTLVTIKCTTHRHGTSAIQRSSFSSEIIIVNSELTISFSIETFIEMAANTNNNNLNASVPIFMGSDFRVWQQKMGDFLKSQCLWCITTGAAGSTRPVDAIMGAPTPAEALLQAAWHENSEQVQGIIGSCISQMLCPHIVTTCAETWTNLRTRFGTPGVSEIAMDMYVAYSMKLLSTHNPHLDMERMNMLFECLMVNGVDFNDSVQGIILLNAIPKE